MLIIIYNHKLNQAEPFCQAQTQTQTCSYMFKFRWGILPYSMHAVKFCGAGKITLYEVWFKKCVIHKGIQK